MKGDRVALLAPNGIDWAVAAFAVMRIGAVLVPLSTLLRPPELLAQLQVASVVAPRRRAHLPRIATTSPTSSRPRPASSPPSRPAAATPRRRRSEPSG